MPQLPDVKQQVKGQVAAWTDAAQSGPTQVLHALSDLAERSLQAGGDVSLTLVEFAGQARMRLATLPSTLGDDIRRFFNPLGLATRGDIELQSRRQRNRVSAVLKEFLEAQRGRDEALRDSLLGELREQLQSFASAIDDDDFDFDFENSLSALKPRRAPTEPADFEYLDDDELELGSYQEIIISDNERMAIRRTLLSSNDFDDD